MGTSPHEILVVAWTKRREDRRVTLAVEAPDRVSGANVLALGTYGLVNHRCSSTAHDA